MRITAAQGRYRTRTIRYSRIAFYLIALALEHLPLGPVYAAWTGLGIALTAIVGAVVWKEGFNVKKALGLAAIIGGVVVLKLGV